MSETKDAVQAPVTRTEWRVRLADGSTVTDSSAVEDSSIGASTQRGAEQVAARYNTQYERLGVPARAVPVSREVVTTYGPWTRVSDGD